MRTWMRDSMEVEAEDWPDPLIDLGVREGYERVVSRSSRWPFYEARWDTPIHALSPYADRPSDADEITEVRLAGRRLEYWDVQDAEDRYGDRIGVPKGWSQWGGQMIVWPTPTDEGTLSLRGWRTPTPFLSESGWVPDLPVEFHPLLMDWAMANEYQRQDDPEMSSTYRHKFEEQLTSLVGRHVRVPSPRPLVVGGVGNMQPRHWAQV